MQKYFNILGISPTASESDIRSAFKEKAKITHPDRNSSPNAHNEFLELFEAFNWAIRNTNKPNNDYPNEVQEVFDQAIKQRQKEREEAIRFSRMRYKAWTQTKEYKDLVNIVVIQRFLSATFILFIIISVCGIFGKITQTKYGIQTGLTIGFITSFYIIKKKMFGSWLNVKELLKAISNLFSLSTGIYALLFIINSIIFFRIGFNTLINTFLLLSIYIILFVIIRYISKFIFKNKKQLFKKFILSNSLISILLLLNFFITSNPTTEIHKIARYQSSSLIKLENDNLKQYPALRFFYDIDKLLFVQSLKFTLHEGFLGIKVNKKTTLIN